VRDGCNEVPVSVAMTTSNTFCLLSTNSCIEISPSIDSVIYYTNVIGVQQAGGIRVISSHFMINAFGLCLFQVALIDSSLWPYSVMQ
jgi:hypothetical protein